MRAIARPRHCDPEGIGADNLADNPVEWKVQHGMGQPPMKRRLLLQRVALAVATGAAGAALNLFAPTMRLMPGRILTLPIAILYGPAFGGIAALLGALPFARSYPVFLVILGAEGLRDRRLRAASGRSSLLAGALVWMAVAATMELEPDWFGVGQPALDASVRSLCSSC